eukprot:2079040-Amphidinium_carterae.1
MQQASKQSTRVGRRSGDEVQESPSLGGLLHTSVGYANHAFTTYLVCQKATPKHGRAFKTTQVPREITSAAHVCVEQRWFTLCKPVPDEIAASSTVALQGADGFHQASG